MLLTFVMGMKSVKILQILRFFIGRARFPVLELDGLDPSPH